MGSAGEAPELWEEDCRTVPAALCLGIILVGSSLGERCCFPAVGHRVVSIHSLSLLGKRQQQKRQTTAKKAPGLKRWKQNLRHRADVNETGQGGDVALHWR